MSDSPTSVTITPESIKVLAHPLRSRLVGALRLLGPSSATTLAAELATNTGATSYHLRRLESVGLVRDTGEGDGRTRLWEATADQSVIEPSSFDGDDDSEAALGWLARDWLAHFTTKYGRWLEVQREWPSAWRDAASMNDALVVATPAQLVAMGEEIRAVVERSRRVGQGNPEAKRVAAYSAFYPVDMDRPPRS
jgi:DNA-binding transcriptional ArsR family regulator